MYFQTHFLKKCHYNFEILTSVHTVYVEKNVTGSVLNEKRNQEFCVPKRILNNFVLFVCFIVMAAFFLWQLRFLQV
jgi:hypothetical protein